MKWWKNAVIETRNRYIAMQMIVRAKKNWEKKEQGEDEMEGREQKVSSLHIDFYFVIFLTQEYIFWNFWGSFIYLGVLLMGVNEFLNFAAIYI